jgi:hypothetical protein
MATLLSLPNNIVGARRTYNPLFTAGSNISSPAQAGMSAISDSEVLNNLVRALQSFYTPGPMNEAPSEASSAGVNIMSVLGDTGAGSDIQGPNAPSDPGSQMSPGTLSTIGTISEGLGALTGNQTATDLASMAGLGATMASQSRGDALQSMGSFAAQMAGANPLAVGAGNLAVDALQGGPITAQDVVARLASIAFGLTPVGKVNNIIGFLTGKAPLDIQSMVKGALTPSEGIDISAALAKQANEVAAAKNIDPLDALLGLNQAFGTAPANPMSLGNPATASTPAGESLTDLAISMLNMPGPMGEATATNPEAPQGIPGELGFGTIAAPAAPATDTSPAGPATTNATTSIDAALGAALDFGGWGGGGIFGAAGSDAGPGEGGGSGTGSDSGGGASGVAGDGLGLW